MKDSMQLDEEMVHVACHHFDRYGGSFNRTLAHLWRIADSQNKARLMRAFHDLFLGAYNRALDERNNPLTTVPTPNGTAFILRTNDDN